MIVYRKGDVVEALKSGEIEVLVHGVNCQGAMNSGIAKQIRKEFPIVFEEYRRYFDIRNLGDIQQVKVDNFENKHVVNTYTQSEYGYDGLKFCSYDAIDEAMTKLARVEGAIGMPKIGAGLGGGNWEIIEAIINSHFPEREIHVYELE